jgi:hypothetical protein
MERRCLAPAANRRAWYTAAVVLYLYLAGPGADKLHADPPAGTGGKSLVIVAPRAFHAALAQFVAHKEKLLSTKLVALEDVLARQPGVDDPEKLKWFLYDRWKNDRVGYVLLVGNCRVMPVRYMVLDRVTPAAFDYAFYPSDLYYADVARADGSFDDWNARRDGIHAEYFGEVRGEKNKNDPINFDKIHYVPEIAVGRWPVATPAQAARVARKTIRYENDLRSGHKPGARNAAFFVVEGWVDGRGAMDAAAGSLNGRYTIKRHYYGGGPPPNEEQVRSVLRSGAGVVFHVGHGSDSDWQNCTSLSAMLKTRNFESLPVMISAGCSTARCAPLPPYEGYVDVHGQVHKGTNNGEVFTSPPPPPLAYQPHQDGAISLGEGVVTAGDGGAVAYIGCNTGGQPCALTLLQGFATGLGQGKEPRLGDAWVAAVRHYYEKEHLATLKPNADWYPPSIFFQAMKYMVFGDPSLAMPGPQ